LANERKNVDCERDTPGKPIEKIKGKDRATKMQVQSIEFAPLGQASKKSDYNIDSGSSS